MTYNENVSECVNEHYIYSTGHVLYEMAEGKCFSTPLPVHSDYEGSSVEEILDYIFKMVKKNKAISHEDALKKVRYKHADIKV